MATARPFSAPTPGRSDRIVQGISKAISLPEITSDPSLDNYTQRNAAKATTLSIPLNDTTNWDDIDPVTGLSKEYMTAIEIIDSCDFEELRRFNAPLLANQSMSIGQQIEMYYNVGESREHRRKRKEKAMGRRKSVVAEKVAAVVALFRKAQVDQSRRE